MEKRRQNIFQIDSLSCAIGHSSGIYVETTTYVHGKEIKERPGVPDCINCLPNEMLEMTIDDRNN